MGSYFLSLDLSLRRVMGGLCLVASMCAAAGAAWGKGGDDVTGPYDPVPKWFVGNPGGLPVLKAGELIFPISVEPQSADRIFVLTTGSITGGGANGRWPFGPIEGVPNSPWYAEQKGRTVTRVPLILVVNRDGNVLANWSQWSSMLIWPRAIRINPYDPEKHVWVVDRDNTGKGGRIYEFTNDGKKLVRTIGSPEFGTDENHFGQPTDIAWLPDGEFFVTDGEINSRVIKFDKNGKYLMSWGTKGNGPGQFNVPYSVAIDANQHVYVADRGNCRVQVFDANGKFLAQWPDISNATRIMISPDQSAWVIESGSPEFCGGVDRLLKYDLSGHLLTFWGTGMWYDNGEGVDYPGELGSPEDFGVDNEGNVYVVSAWTHEVNKFVPKKDGDPSRMVGKPFNGAAQNRTDLTMNLLSGFP